MSYITNTCPACGGKFEFDSKEVGREWTCPHCQGNVVLLPKSKTWILEKWMAVAGFCFSVSLLHHFTGGTPFVENLFTDFGMLIGTALVPFSPAMLISVSIKGKSGLVIGVTIAAIVSALMLYGSHVSH